MKMFISCNCLSMYLHSKFMLIINKKMHLHCIQTVHQVGSKLTQIGFYSHFTNYIRIYYRTSCYGIMGNQVPVAYEDLMIRCQKKEMIN